MPHFDNDEELKIYEIARKHLMKIDSNVQEYSMATLAWRRQNDLIVVVWANKTLPSPDWDKDTEYYRQYNYHVAMKVIFKSGQRFLRVAGYHEGSGNVWHPPFKCSSCEWDLKQKA